MSIKDLIASLPSLILKLGELVSEPSPELAVVVGPDKKTAMLALRDGYTLKQLDSTTHSVPHHTVYTVEDFVRYIEKIGKPVVVIGGGMNVAKRCVGMRAFIAKDEEGDQGHDITLSMQTTSQWRRVVHAMGRQHSVPDFMSLLRDLDGCLGKVNENNTVTWDRYLLSELSTLQVSKNASAKVTRASNGAVLSVENSGGTSLSAQIPDEITITVRPLMESYRVVALKVRIDVDVDESPKITLSCPTMPDSVWEMTERIVGDVRDKLDDKHTVLNGTAKFDKVRSELGDPGENF